MTKGFDFPAFLNCSEEVLSVVFCMIFFLFGLSSSELELFEADDISNDDDDDLLHHYIPKF